MDSIPWVRCASGNVFSTCLIWFQYLDYSFSGSSVAVLLPWCKIINLFFNVLFCDVWFVHSFCIVLTFSGWNCFLFSWLIWYIFVICRAFKWLELIKSTWLGKVWTACSDFFQIINSHPTVSHSNETQGRAGFRARGAASRAAASVSPSSPLQI